MKHYSQEDGLPTVSVNTIEQDREGFIWLGTDIGLSRFDGYRFRNYTIIDGLPDNEILDLQCDQQGRLWIISQGELCYFQNGKFHPSEEIVGRDKNVQITSFKAADDGSFWLTTRNKIFALDSTLNRVIWTSENIDMPLNNPIVQFEDKNGDIYFYNNHSHLLRINTEGIFTIPLDFSPLHNVPFKSNMINDTIYHVNNKGLIALTEYTNNVVDIPIYKTVKSAKNIQQNIVLSKDKNTPFQTPLPFLLKDSKNNIWTTNQQGNFTTLNHTQNNIPNFPCHLLASDIHEDKGGNLWFATKNDGVYVWYASNIEKNDIQVLLEDKKIERLRSSKNKVIAGTNKKLYIIENNQVNPLDINQSSTDDIKNLIMIDESNILWSMQDKLCLYNGALQTYYLPDIQAMTALDDTLYYGTSQELRYVAFSDLSFSPVNEFATQGKPILQNRNITATYFDKKQTLWIGTESGLDRYFGGDSLINYKDIDLIFGHGISAIGETADSTIWVATKGAGVLAIRGDDHLKIDAEQLSHNYCKDLVAEDSVVWVATSKGINSISDVNFSDKTFYVSTLQGADNLNTYNIHALAVNAKKVFAGTDKGVFQIDKRYAQRAYSLDKVFIADVLKSNNERLTIQDSYEFTHRDNTIRINYSALDYNYQGNIIYEYKMAGVEEKWQRTRASGTPLYVLPPGDYWFKVRALNSKGKTSPTTQISIKIRPPFSASNPFRIIMAILGIWLIISAYRMYADSKKNAELQQLVAQKTADLNTKVTELERSNNELEEFNYVVAHDLKAPLRTMASFVQLLERKDGDRLSEEGKEYVGYVNRGAKRLQEVIADLLTFAGVNKTDNQTESVNLNEVVSEVLDHLQGVIRSKNVIIEKDELPVIQGQFSQMLQVFQNLISNGIKYQPEDNQPVIKIKVDKKDTHWLFLVEDNGIGIDRQYEDKVFRIFQRLHNDEEYSGTGIGLPIVKKIIESSGGEIYFESQVGKGTTFLFTLPF